MRGKKILECKIFGRVSSWGNPPHEEIWKSNLEEQLSRMKPQEPSNVQKFSIKIDFYINKDRIEKGNDLDNLAKPVLDSLIKTGFISDDSLVYHLELSKRPITERNEYISICIWEWLC